jgi:outer membrane receptor protein involved in Fe transport
MMYGFAASNPALRTRLPKALAWSLTCSTLVVLAAVAASAAGAQTPAAGSIADSQGAPIANARLRSLTGTLLATADSAGHIDYACPATAQTQAAPCTVVVEADGFAPRQIAWQPGAIITLQPASVAQQVSVTAFRTPIGDLESPANTRTLSNADLRESASITLDGQLREAAGVETFRRSSSLVANPSSQGISLRGLGSTSASRTLVTEDDIPLNDAFAGWIHWEELPELSIRSVELVRGGASDLYGSSAIGGVINVIPFTPTKDEFELKSSYGSENTYQNDLLFSARKGHFGVLATGGVLGTDGYILTTPDQRGLIDIPSNVHAQNGLFLVDRQQGNLRVFARASSMNEARNNGTPVQTNGTRLWRYAVGSDWTPDNGGHLTFRAYGGTEHYRQTFSTIGAGRNSEVLNRFAKTPDNELGAVLHWSQPVLTHTFGPGLLLLVGADTHDVRADDQEEVIKAGVQSRVNQSDRQRQTGAYGELLMTKEGWTVSLSGRFDWFSNFDGTSWATGAPVGLPQFSEQVFDPRLGVSRKIGQHFALTGTGFRAYRAPTANELYRSTQVGSLLTLPNNNLRSERATGWEAGVAMQQRWGTMRTSYFWTRVDRPITALTTNPSSNPILLKRENLGQIESRGVSVDFEFQPQQPEWRWMTFTTGYQHTNATVTQYAQQPQLVGNWIPQVAHNTATAQLRGYHPKLGTLSIQTRISGHQFDDDANTYLLHSYFRLDAYASHDLGRRIELFASGENLLDRSIEVGRTPTLTLGTPQIARAGFLFKLSPGAR